MGNHADSSSSNVETQGPDRSKFYGRRSFLKGMGATGAAVLAGGALFADRAAAQATTALSQADAAILQFLAAAELIETDLWAQYNELGGAGGGNPAYVSALLNIDSDMQRYIQLNTEDEQSHAAFLNAYLQSRGAQPVNLDKFRTLSGSKATGASKTKRLTSLLNLNVDTSWYTRYRSTQNADFGASFPQAIEIKNRPAIPVNDDHTPPHTKVPAPAKTDAEKHMQVIACTAAFHFAFIESGGSSLYATLSDQVSDPEALRVVTSIGGTETMHFATWQDDAGNAAAKPIAPVTDPFSKLTIPNLNAKADGKLFATNRIFPHPCEFIDSSLPLCSIVRPTNPQLGGAMAAVNALTADGLFTGQPQAFFTTLKQMAQAADAAVRSV